MIGDPRPPPMPPRATYRLQLTRDFAFAQAGRLAPYLAALGISHVYLSPILAARSGSRHGYDVVDHDRLAPDLGTEAEFRDMVGAFRRHELGIIVDLVPNHMGVSPENPRWMDVLRTGAEGGNGRFFDIDWQSPHPHLAGKVLLPVLDRPLDAVLGAGEIGFVDEGAGICAAWHDHRLPLAPASFLGSAEALNAAPLEQRRAILERQHWCLAEWQRAATEMNYRRFFAINDLIAIRIDEPGVFEASHGLILRLVEEQAIDGLRIDHIDGLADPRAYLETLADAVRARGREPYILVEKILGEGETLHGAWPIAGSTGYDRLAGIDRLFCDGAGAGTLLRGYRRTTRRQDGLGAQLRAAKQHFLESQYVGEVGRLAHAVHRLAQQRPVLRDRPVAVFEQALSTLIVALPVYRCYVDRHGAQPADHWWLDAAFERAALEDRYLAAFLRDLLSADAATHAELGPEKALDVVMLFQEITGPAMAKGLEDTVFYRYVPLLALNEVGGQPEPVPFGQNAFHSLQQAKRRSHPDELVPGSTHDTKRGEDARSRLLCLTSAPELWAATLERWRGLTGAGSVPGGPVVPGPNVSHYLFQSLLAAWPPRLTLDDQVGLAAFAERLRPAMLKAAREAGERTSWTAPDPAYEADLDAFIAGLLDPHRSPEFLADAAATAERFGRWGALTSLSATLLRLTVPGVPDIFQGSEGWNFAMVDPDNRRPVDFLAAAQRLPSALGTLSDLPSSWHDGTVKTVLIRQVLALRRQLPHLFARGDYVPLPVEGDRADCLIAFSRSDASGSFAVLAPRFWPRLWPAERVAPDWGETSIALPEGVWQEHLTGAPVTAGPEPLRLDVLLHGFPCALLVSAPNEG